MSGQLIAVHKSREWKRPNGGAAQSSPPIRAEKVQRVRSMWEIQAMEMNGQMRERYSFNSRDRRVQRGRTKERREKRP